MSYNAETKRLKLDDFYCSGITILGYDEEGNKINPAMPGSNITLADFSHIDDSRSIDTTTKGDIAVMTKFEELLSKYNKTVDEIDFDYSTMTEEELEAKFAELFANDDPVADDPTDTTEPNDDTANEDSTTDNDSAATDDNAAADNANVNMSAEPEQTDEHMLIYSINGKNFEISLSDIQYAVSELVNNQYGEADQDYYITDVYQDSKTVVMRGIYSGKAYRQSYKVRNGEYSLTGDRVEVFAQYLTQDEISKLDEMRSKYSVAVEKLGKYEAEPKKLDVLNSADYAAVADKDEFKSLKDNHFDMSIEDVTAKANEILLKYAKENSKAEFDKKSKTPKVRPFPEPPKYNERKGRYGDLFTK